MFEADRITEHGARTILNLLNESIKVEYGMIVAYPRLIDHLVQVEELPPEKVPTTLARLGEESAKHMNKTANIITSLGRDPQWNLAAVDIMDDVRRVLREQMEKEKLALSVYRQARKVAEESQVKGFRGLFQKQSTRMSRGMIIDILTEMAADEERHIILLQNAIDQLDRV